MPRPLRLVSNILPYHVSSRSHNREWFPTSIDNVWQIMAANLHLTKLLYEIKIHSFVLMDNHFHMLATTPNANLSAAMRFFLTETSRELNKLSGHINQNFGGRHFQSIISNERYYRHVYKYVYLNPVSAGIVSRAEEYRYSTLGGFLGLSRLDIPVDADEMLMDDIDDTLGWINRMPPPNDLELVRKALRRQRFRFTHRKGKQKVCPLDLREL